MQPFDQSQISQDSQDLNDDRRSSARQQMDVPITLISETGRNIAAKIVNMNESGLMIALNANDQVNLYSSYKIEVPSYFCSQCFAIWQEDGKAGMLLSLPVHPAVIAGLGRRFPSPKENV